MPNFDGGHYFFTAVVPVCNRGIVEHEGMKSSPIHMVREALETLPTALQSHATEEVGIQSPFARSTRTHFARLVVLDQPYYNGRDHADAVLTAASGIFSSVDLLKAQPHDLLACPYLLVMIDFDPADPSGRGEPRAYLEHLWSTMAEELRALFAYCYGFPQVRDAASFADFLIGCQIETTMPFNDYWTEPPPFKSMSVVGLAIPPLAGLGLGAAATRLGHLHWWLAVPLIVLLILLGLAVDYWLVMRRGAQPFPASGATLPRVLKALYLQQAFVRFVAERQNADAAADGAAFRAFLAAHRPNDLDAPTQKPGVVRSVFPGAAA
ncbi:MAG: hypothetical protein JO008_01665 [Alphaproteobacteria bacterium]|nr:hypothetical protein [Alphaproteobacteria bacterium]